MLAELIHPLSSAFALSECRLICLQLGVMSSMFRLSEVYLGSICYTQVQLAQNTYTRRIARMTFQVSDILSPFFVWEFRQLTTMVERNVGRRTDASRDDYDDRIA